MSKSGGETQDLHPAGEQKIFDGQWISMTSALEPSVLVGVGA